MNQITNKLKSNKITLQADSTVTKEVSFGSHNNTQNFIEEGAKALEFGFEIENDSASDISIIFTASPQRLFPDVAAYIQSMAGASAFLVDGRVATDVTAVTKNSNRSIDRLTNYADSAPFRFTKFVMTSTDNNGNPESTNYNNDIKVGWFSPFEDTVEDSFSLRSIVRDKFQDHLLEVDFQKDSPTLKPIISNEHYMVITVNAGTTLSIDAYVGAQLSLAQRLYRLVNKVDDLIRPLRQSLSTLKK